MANKTKLELTWIGKENRPRLEPRILLEDADKSYHAKQRITDKDIFDNRLIFGDNLLALKALEQECAGKVKCIYIDPPYNTGSAFTHYDDGLEHSLWLSLLAPRLELLRRLLSPHGSLWISINDIESQFVANVIWQKRYSPSNDAIWFSESHDHILVYARDRELWNPNRLERSDETNTAYRNPDNDPRGPWRPDNYKCNKTAAERPNLYYAIHQPNANKELWPKKTAVWRYSQDTHKEHIAKNLIWWGRDGMNDVPAYKRFLHDVDHGTVPQTIWGWREVGHNQDAKREQQDLSPNDPFATPKPEKLIARVVEVATNPGEIVLDSFAGSGTTGAVAHKMGRQWILAELAEHCHTHIIPRLKKVIDGDDPGGITESVGWKGGGGFRYYRLAPSMLEKDEHENYIISTKYNAPMLAEAMCKQMGFTFSPSDTVYWQHGLSSETDFIFITTQTFSRQQLAALSAEVGERRSLMICCSALRSKATPFHNLTLVKIPNAVLSRCEWGKDDYSLNVANLPMMEEPPDEEAAVAAQVRPAKTEKQKRRAKSQIALFAGEGQ
jgi:adenine-specific DNA-methyltransferase